MSLEEYADKIGADLSQRPVPLTGLDELPDVGSLHHARAGDSISSILGTSNPAAIGAFMEANGLKNSGLRAGQSYLVPRRADLADVSMVGRGQEALYADNARAQERARNAILPGDAVTARPGAVMFDPQKGILATRTKTQGSNAEKPDNGFLKFGRFAGAAGNTATAYDFQNALVDRLLKTDVRKTVRLRFLGPALTTAEHISTGIGEVKNNASAGTVAGGVAGRLGAIALATGAGTLAGGPLGGVVAGFAADKAMGGQTNEQIGRFMQRTGLDYLKHYQNSGGML